MPLNYIAILKTRCGCQKVIQVPRFENTIRQMLYPDLPNTLWDIDKPWTHPTSIHERLFEYRGRIGPETAEYLERWTE